MTHEVVYEESTGLLRIEISKTRGEKSVDVRIFPKTRKSEQARTENLWVIAKTESISHIKQALKDYGYREKEISEIINKLKENPIGLVFRVKKVIMSVSASFEVPVWWTATSPYPPLGIHFEYRSIDLDETGMRWSERGWEELAYVETCLAGCDSDTPPCTRSGAPIEFLLSPYGFQPATIVKDNLDIVTNKFRVWLEEYGDGSLIDSFNLVIWAEPVGWDSLLPVLRGRIRVPLLENAESLVLEEGETTTIKVEWHRISGAGTVTLYANGKKLVSGDAKSSVISAEINYTAPEIGDAPIKTDIIRIQADMEDKKTGKVKTIETKIPIVIKNRPRPVIRRDIMDWLVGPIVYEGNCNDNLDETNDCAEVEITLKNVSPTPGYYAVYNTNLNQIAAIGHLDGHTSTKIRIKVYGTSAIDKPEEINLIAIPFKIYSSETNDPLHDGYITDEFIVAFHVVRPRVGIIREIFDERGNLRERLRLGEKFRLRYRFNNAGGGTEPPDFFKREYPVIINHAGKATKVSVGSKEVVVEIPYTMEITESYTLGFTKIQRKLVDKYAVGDVYTTILQESVSLSPEHAIFLWLRDNTIRRFLRKVPAVVMKMNVYPDEDTNIQGYFVARSISVGEWDEVDVLGSERIEGTQIIQKVYTTAKKIVAKTDNSFYGDTITYAKIIFDKPLDLVVNGEIKARDIKWFALAKGGLIIPSESG